jgi:hypothetical protein
MIRHANRLGRFPELSWLVLEYENESIDWIPGSGFETEIVHGTNEAWPRLIQ